MWKVRYCYRLLLLGGGFAQMPLILNNKTIYEYNAVYMRKCISVHVFLIIQ
jgi:hypothetical protein